MLLQKDLQKILQKILEVTCFYHLLITSFLCYSIVHIDWVTSVDKEDVYLSSYFWSRS